MTIPDGTEFTLREITGIDLQFLEANGYIAEIDGDRKVVTVETAEER